MQIIATQSQLIQLKQQLDALLPIAASQAQTINQKLWIEWCYAVNYKTAKSLTHGETKMLILHDITAQGKSLQHHFDVKNFFRAVNKLAEYAHDARFFDVLFIKEMHLIACQNEEKISPEAENALSELVLWYKDALITETTDTVDLAITVHQRFLNVSPFSQGNYRVAQLLLNFLLMREGYPPLIVRPQDREAYTYALQEAEKDNKNYLYLLLQQRLCDSLKLNIKGAQGFSVERVTNVDEEVNLFKQMLDQKTPSTITRVTADIAEQHITASISPLVRLFIDKIKPFDEMYAERKIEMRLQFGDFVSTHYLNSAKEFEKIILEHIEDGVGSIMIEYRLVVFKHNKKQVVNHNTTLFVIFQRFDYQVYSPGIEPAFAKRYYETLSEPEMSEITTNIAKKLLESVKDSME